MTRNAYRTGRLILIAVLVIAATRGASAGGPLSKQVRLGDLPSKESRDALLEFSKDYLSALSKYYKSLESARSYAGKKGDVDEVKRIQDALEGEDVYGFTSSSAERAHGYFHSSLKRAAERLKKDLESLNKKLLGDGKIDEADAVSSLIERLNAALEVEDISKPKTKKVTVYANKDWQETGIEVPQKCKISIKAEGEWGPGRIRTGKKRWETLKGDADTYNMQAQVKGKQVGRGGKEWEFTAPVDGEIEFRMAQYGNRWRRAEAEGSLAVTVTWTLPENSRPETVYAIIIELLGPVDAERAESSPQKLVEGESSGSSSGKRQTESDSKEDKPAEATASKTGFHRFTLDAAINWQDTRVTLKQGDRVTIRAAGKWTRGFKRKKDPEIAWGDANRFPMEGKVGDKVLGRGGNEVEFTSPTDGVLLLRMWQFEKWKERSNPEGKIMLSIEVKR